MDHRLLYRTKKIQAGSCMHCSPSIQEASTEPRPCFKRHMLMNWLTYHTSVFFLFLGTTLVESAEQTWQSPWRTTHLEKRIQAIDEELETLAQPRLLSGIGPIGYRSQSHDTDGHEEWIEVRLRDETTINEIILVPSLYHNPDSTVEAFPYQKLSWARSS